MIPWAEIVLPGDFLVLGGERAEHHIVLASYGMGDVRTGYDEIGKLEGTDTTPNIVDCGTNCPSWFDGAQPGQ